MNPPPRVALVTDAFHETNGAARTCRELAAYAQRNQLPFCRVSFGPDPGRRCEGSVRVLELRRSKASLPIDTDLWFDTLFYRHRRSVEAALREFQPDLVHIIGTGDAGILGAIAAAVLRVPLVLSWHTNLHEFAAHRIGRNLSCFPRAIRQTIPRLVERFVLDRLVWFFSRGQLLLAPNPAVVDLLKSRTGRPTFSMGRGVDTALFHPRWRDREDDDFTIGFVGRLMPEKNVRFLARLERALEETGHGRFRIVVVGAGSEAPWLRQNLRRGVFTGALHGEQLARVYANFDVFAFPSQTDAFGQVVQEALSSGVPAVVTESGGAKYLVAHGETGFIARSEQEFIDAVILLKQDPGLRRRMAAEARRRTRAKTWDEVFFTLYKVYELCQRMRPYAQVTNGARRLTPMPIEYSRRIS